MSGALALMLGVGHSSGGVTTGLSATPNATTFSASISGSGTATTSACVITPAGGTSPYTYAWTRTAGDTGTNADSPTAASTTFSRVYGPLSRSDSSTWKCVVSDSASHTATVSGITVSTDNQAGV